MPSNMSFEESMKNLIKIIYQKEKQIQKYKTLLNKSQASKNSPLSIQTDQSNISRQIKEASKKILQMQKNVDSVNSLLSQQIQHNYQLQQNNQIMESQLKKMAQQKEKLLQRQNNFKKQIQKITKNNEVLQQKYVSQVKKREQELRISMKYKNLLEQVNRTNQKIGKQHQVEIESYEQKIEALQNQLNRLELNNKNQSQSEVFELSKVVNSLKKQIYLLKAQNTDKNCKIIGFSTEIHALSEEINNREDEVSKIYEQILSLSDILDIPSAEVQNIKNSENIFKMLNSIKTHLTEEQNKKKHNNTQFFINQTLNGISRIKESFQAKLDQLNEDQFNTSDFKINEQMLIQNLQKQCQNQSNHSKLVELCQVRQNLKMTKEVNMQLFDQINQKQKIIRQFKSSFKNFLTLNKEKLSNLEQVKSIAQLIGEH